MSNSVQPYGQQPTRLLCLQDSLGKNTGVGCHFLLHGIFPTQGSNLGLLLCRKTLYPLSHEGSLGVGRSPGEGNGYPLKFSTLENSLGFTVHGVAKSRTRLSDFTFFLSNPTISVSLEEKRYKQERGYPVMTEAETGGMGWKHKEGQDWG